MEIKRVSMPKGGSAMQGLEVGWGWIIGVMEGVHSKPVLYMNRGDVVHGGRARVTGENPRLYKSYVHE